MNKKIKLGLALGGGGARGLSHIGVLKVLERNKIPVDLIVGTSIGALAGAAYAVKPDIVALEKRVSEVLGSKTKDKTGLKLLGLTRWDEGKKPDWLHRLIRIAQKEVFLSLAVFRNALLSLDDMRENVKAFIPDIDIRETVIPYAATAVDLVSGEQVVLRQGSLINAVMASCAVPGFMPPILWNGQILVDGGVVDVVPTRPAKNMGADIVVGVDVGLGFYQSFNIEDGIDVINRAAEIMTFHLSRHGRNYADVLIEPAVRHVDWVNFLPYKELIHLGEKAAQSKIKDIHEVLQHPFKKRAYTWAKKIFEGRGRVLLI